MGVERAMEGWKGPGKGNEVHEGLGRAMERVVRSSEGWREPRRGGQVQGGLERPGSVEESQGVL